MTAFLNKLFTAKSFDSDFALVTGVKGSAITMPDGIRLAVLFYSVTCTLICTGWYQ